MTLTTATPVEIDNVLYPLLAKRWEIHHKAHQLRQSIARTVWPAEFQATYERYMDKFSKHRTYPIQTAYDGGRTLNDYNARLNAAVEALAAVNAEIAPLEAEYARRPWSRYVIVPGGHIHRYQGCSTLRPTTETILLIEASGVEAEAEVIARYSYTACTKCFPNAPVAEAQVDPSVCTAGPYDYEKTKGYGARYVTCSVCKGFVSRHPSTGKQRKHKKGGTA